jgi:hypothetical protein
VGGIVWAFAPFVAFVVATRFWSPAVALAAGAVVAAALVGRGVFVQKQPPRILEAGTAILFLALVVYTVVAHATWSVFAARLVVDAGLLTIVVVSIAIRQPFTIQYAREQVPEEFWSSPRFLHINDAISGAWALAFALIVACDYAVIAYPATPAVLAFAVIVAVIAGASAFTTWYPKHMRNVTSGAPAGRA